MNKKRTQFGCTRQKIAHSFSGGFTLIELLVVIAIIGILASVILASLNSARAKGRDAKRVSDLRQIQTALELYYDQNNAYPQCAGNNDFCTSNDMAALNSSDISTLAIVPAYISQVAHDPKDTSQQYGYYYVRGYSKYISGTTTCYKAATGNPAQSYILATRLEASSASVVKLNCTNSGIYDNAAANYLVGN